MFNTFITGGTLTADINRITERSCDLWVKVDHKVAFLCNLVIAIFHLLGYPLSKVVASKRVDHIYDPLARKLGYVSLIRQVLVDLLDHATIV